MVSASLISLFSAQKILVVNATVTSPDLLFLKELAETKKLIPALERRYRMSDAVGAVKDLAKGHARGKSVVVME